MLALEKKYPPGTAETYISRMARAVEILFLELMEFVKLNMEHTETRKPHNDREYDEKQTGSTNDMEAINLGELCQLCLIEKR